MTTMRAPLSQSEPPLLLDNSPLCFSRVYLSLSRIALLPIHASCTLPINVVLAWLPQLDSLTPQLSAAASAAHRHNHAVSILDIHTAVESQILAPHIRRPLRFILFLARHAALQHQPAALYRQA